MTNSSNQKDRDRDRGFMEKADLANLGEHKDEL
jgi:hypothetical protein